MRSLRPFLRLVLSLLVCGAPAPAQEVQEDQDPVDLDWVPAWDTPFWPVPSGAALELAAGRRMRPAPSEAGASPELGSGDYVLALLTLPLGARPRASDEDPPPARSPRPTAPPPPRRDPAAAGEPRSGQVLVAQTASDLPPPDEAPEAEPHAREHAEALPPVDDGPRQAERHGGGFDRVPLDLLEDAIERAEKAAGFARALGRLASIGQRSRWSGLAPELRLRGATGIDQTRSVDSAGLVPSDETLRDASDSLVEVRLTFHLERLLHSGQEVALERARQQLLVERAELRARVGQELLTYVRALARSESEHFEEEEHEEEREKVELAAERARLVLYLLTDGWFRGEETLRAYAAPRAR